MAQRVIHHPPRAEMSKTQSVLKDIMNPIERTMFRISMAALLGAGFVYLVHTMMFGSLTPTGEFSVSGLLWISGLALVFRLIASVFARKQ